MVVWFLAAMSLLVAGIVHQGRIDSRLAQAHLARAKVNAAGDGAAQLMMAQFTRAQDARPEGAARVMRSTFHLGDVDVEVTLTPASGLIDIYSAPPQLLAQLFAHRGKLPMGEAQRLAHNVVQLRTPVNRGDGPVLTRMSTQEDMLKVPGFNRVLLDALRDDIRAVSGGSGFNWSAAPDDLLNAVQGANQQQVDRVMARRAESGDMGAGAQNDNHYRVDAVVHYGGRSWLRRRWATLSGAPGSSLGWQFLRTESPRVVAQR
ncbi:general secretion pathway protein GspK [Parahaliea mediterranea]|uniref:general secretion pathway protein GspK n=1 Tax=Parahaliea mediterranea TaxID=651086 RepID=UPI001300A8C1|nr:general secretion pathway protein GspK [Parahaliea mediterranea]